MSNRSFDDFSILPIFAAVKQKPGEIQLHFIKQSSEDYVGTVALMFTIATE